MLKHNPKLRKAWGRAKKRKDKWGEVTLDMRFKTSRNFVEEFGNHAQNSIKNSGLDLNELTAIINHAKRSL